MLIVFISMILMWVWVIFCNEKLEKADTFTILGLYTLTLLFFVLQWKIILCTIL